MAKKAYGDENRKKRVSLIVTPSMYKDVTTMAAIRGTTINDFIIGLIEPIIAKNRTTIDKVQGVITDAQLSLFDETGK